MGIVSDDRRKRSGGLVIVVSAGMEKAGTGWYFNITDDLLVAAGQVSVRGLRGRFGLERVLEHHNCNVGVARAVKLLRLLAVSARGHTFAVKTHEAPTLALRLLLRLGLARATFLFRDPRDAALSAFEHGQAIRARGESHTFARLATLADAVLYVRDRLPVWDAWVACPCVLKVRYEDLLADPAREGDRLARFLGVDLGPATRDAILARHAREPAADDPALRDALHFNRGVAGRYREAMGRDELALSERALGPYLARMGYPV